MTKMHATMTTTTTVTTIPAMAPTSLTPLELEVVTWSEADEVEKISGGS